ncbi:hypothetical protein Tsubulata_027295, partial [Turnera subulata]
EVEENHVSTKYTTKYNNNNNRTTKGHNRVGGSVSSPSPPPPFSTAPPSIISSVQAHHHNHPRPKTMEEVWNDINLASLHDHSSADQDFPMTTTPRRHSNNPNFILQDFLARPFTKDPPARLVVSAGSTRCNNSTLYGSAAEPPPPPPPATVLSLNSGSGLEFLDGNCGPVKRSSHSHEVLDSYPSLHKRRAAQESDDNSSGDRRHKRMIKNRESAARSRARKQENLSRSLFKRKIYYFYSHFVTSSAYTNELELEVRHLTEENARLRRQHKELCLAAAAQLPKKHTLYRTSTAPF